MSNHDNNNRRAELYYDDLNPQARSIAILIKLLNLQVELYPSGTPRTGRSRRPRGGIDPPTFIHHGTKLEDSHSILVYLCEYCNNDCSMQFYPESFPERINVMNRLKFEQKVLFKCYCDFMTAVLKNPVSQIKFEDYECDICDAYDALDKFLSHCPFVAGHQFTIADVAIMATMSSLDFMFPVESFGDNRWQNLFNWLNCMRNMPVYSVNSRGLERLSKIMECVNRSEPFQNCDAYNGCCCEAGYDQRFSCSFKQQCRQNSYGYNETEFGGQGTFREQLRRHFRMRKAICPVNVPPLCNYVLKGCPQPCLCKRSNCSLRASRSKGGREEMRRKMRDKVLCRKCWCYRDDPIKDDHEDEEDEDSDRSFSVHKAKRLKCCSSDDERCSLNEKCSRNLRLPQAKDSLTRCISCQAEIDEKEHKELYEVWHRSSWRESDLSCKCEQEQERSKEPTRIPSGGEKLRAQPSDNDKAEDCDCLCHKCREKSGRSRKRESKGSESGDESHHLRSSKHREHEKSRDSKHCCKCEQKRNRSKEEPRKSSRGEDKERGRDAKYCCKCEEKRHRTRESSRESEVEGEQRHKQQHIRFCGPLCGGCKMKFGKREMGADQVPKEHCEMCHHLASRKSGLFCNCEKKRYKSKSPPRREKSGMDEDPLLSPIQFFDNGNPKSGDDDEKMIHFDDSPIGQMLRNLNKSPSWHEDCVDIENDHTCNCKDPFKYLKGSQARQTVNAAVYHERRYFKRTPECKDYQSPYNPYTMPETMEASSIHPYFPYLKGGADYQAYDKEPVNYPVAYPPYLPPHLQEQNMCEGMDDYEGNQRYDYVPCRNCHYNGMMMRSRFKEKSAMMTTNCPGYQGVEYMQTKNIELAFKKQMPYCFYDDNCAADKYLLRIGEGERVTGDNQDYEDTWHTVVQFKKRITADKYKKEFEKCEVKCNRVEGGGTISSPKGSLQIPLKHGSSNIVSGSARRGVDDALEEFMGTYIFKNKRYPDSFCKTEKTPEKSSGMPPNTVNPKDTIKNSDLPKNIYKNKAENVVSKNPTKTLDNTKIKDTNDTNPTNPETPENSGTALETTDTSKPNNIENPIKDEVLVSPKDAASAATLRDADSKTTVKNYDINIAEKITKFEELTKSPVSVGQSWESSIKRQENACQRIEELNNMWDNVLEKSRKKKVYAKLAELEELYRRNKKMSAVSDESLGGAIERDKSKKDNNVILIQKGVKTKVYKIK